MQAAHVFALMTSREGCCNAVLESLACGTPVVTTRVGDNAFFVRDGHNGYLTDRTPTSCAEGLRAALTGDLRDRRQISRALTVGSWDDVAIAVSDYFQQLVLGTAT
jgi:glycosyltransferase involved in cell wall biosynthesis